MVPCLRSETYLRNKHDLLSKYFLNSPQRYVFLKCNVYPCIYNTVTLGKIQTTLNMFRSIFSSESQAVLAPESFLVPLPPNIPANTEKATQPGLRISQFRFVGFSWFLFQGRSLLRTDQPEWVLPLAPLSPFIPFLWNCGFAACGEHFKPTSGVGSDWPTGRAGSPSAPQTGATLLWSLRSTGCSLMGQVSHGSHTHHPGGCDTASHSLERAISPFLPVHSSLLPHQCAAFNCTSGGQILDLHRRCTFTLMAKIMRSNTQEHFTTCLLPEVLQEIHFASGLDILEFFM